MNYFKVIYKKLGRNRVWGFADPDKQIVEIDPRAKGKKHLEILVHESLHLLLPDYTEEAIVRISVKLTNTLWREEYRRVDHTDSQPMQDENQ